MTDTEDYIVFDRSGTPHIVVAVKTEIGGIAAGTERRRSEMKWTEITGVDKNVDFKVKGLTETYRIVEQPTGFQRIALVLNGEELSGVTSWFYDEIIYAAPAGIIPLPPPLTDEQRVVLMSLFTMGARYMGMTPDGWKRCFVNKPKKEANTWTSGDTQVLTIASGMAKCLDSLVSWSDPEPFDIGKALGVGE